MANYGIQFKDKDGNNYYPCPFPIGFVYISVNNINPRTYFGGTWERVMGGFIYGRTDDSWMVERGNGTGTWTEGAGGGTTYETVLNVNQIPSHQHSVYDGTYGGRYVEISGFNDTNGGMVPSIRQISGAGTNSGRLFAGPTGGSQGHSHQLASHGHNIPYFACYLWKRTA